MEAFYDYTIIMIINDICQVCFVYVAKPRDPSHATSSACSIYVNGIIIIIIIIIVNATPPWPPV